MKTVCSLEVSKLLKEIGFKKVVSHIYCESIKHNGKDISFDEELDLKDEGRENEIERIPFGSLKILPNSNIDNYYNAVSAPMHYEADEWLRTNYNIFISIIPDYLVKTEKTVFHVIIYNFDEHNKEYKATLFSLQEESFDDAYDKAILKSCQLIIKK